MFWVRSFRRFSYATLAWLCAAVLAPAWGREFKIATWNLNWLTQRQQGDPALPRDVRVREAGDFTRLRAYADKLDADVVAFEEVDGVEAAARVFDPARYQILVIDEAVVQRVGLAVRRGIGVTQMPDVTGLVVNEGAHFPLRAGLDAVLHFPGGQDLRVLAVHLKSGCARGDIAGVVTGLDACADLSRQIPKVADWVAARAREGGAFAVLGDFNRELDRPEAMGAAFAAAAPMVRVTQGFANPCWGGEGFIDHIFAGGTARGWVVPGSMKVLVYTETADRERERLSDHCPVSVRMQVGE